MVKQFFSILFAALSVFISKYVWKFLNIISLASLPANLLTIKENLKMLPDWLVYTLLTGIFILFAQYLWERFKLDTYLAKFIRRPIETENPNSITSEKSPSLEEAVEVVYLSLREICEGNFYISKNNDNDINEILSNYADKQRVLITRDKVNLLINRLKKAGLEPPKKCEVSLESLKEWYEFLSDVRIELATST